MRDLVLYSTEHCSLCDEALDLLLSMPELAGWSVRVVDVSANDDLLARYGNRIPILVADGALEYAAPFVPQTLLTWIRELK